MEMSKNEMLKYAFENGMIDLNTIQKQIDNMEREKYLKMHPFSIWEGTNDGLWHTYLPDKSKGRIPKKRKTKEEIENLIVDYWKEETDKVTVEDVFNEWIDGKLDVGDISQSTHCRYKQLFEQCFENMKSIEIKKIDADILETLIKKSIHDCKMTSKVFSNYRTLLYGIFKKAKKKKYIDFSIQEVMQDIEISRNTFRKREINGELQVYSRDEKAKTEEYLEDNKDIINLGILLLFKTGLRIGELSAIKKEDVENYTIFIRRTETRFNEDGESVYEVKNYPKTEAGIRKAIVPTKYEWIIDDIMKLNQDGEYLFEKNGTRIKSYSFRRRLNYICEAKINIKPKSPHKIRKTYGTLLIDSRIKESSIIESMGHTDINTTKGHYYFSMENIDERRNELDSVEGL